MATVPAQYQNYLNTNNIPQTGGLSPLQIAAVYYMNEGQQIPFFINQEFLQQVKIFASSGLVTPAEVNLPGLAIVERNEQIFLQRIAQDCGPDEQPQRTEEVLLGSTASYQSKNWWYSGSAVVIRGGTAATGVGGPWGTGGLAGPSPVPQNAIQPTPPLVSNLDATYGTGNLVIAQNLR